MSQSIDPESSLAAPGQILDEKGYQGRTPLHEDTMSTAHQGCTPRGPSNQPLHQTQA